MHFRSFKWWEVLQYFVKRRIRVLRMLATNCILFFCHTRSLLSTAFRVRQLPTDDQWFHPWIVGIITTAMDSKETTTYIIVIPFFWAGDEFSHRFNPDHFAPLRSTVPLVTSRKSRKMTPCRPLTPWSSLLRRRKPGVRWKLLLKTFTSAVSVEHRKWWIK